MAAVVQNLQQNVVGGLVVGGGKLAIRALVYRVKAVYDALVPTLKHWSSPILGIVMGFALSFFEDRMEVLRQYRIPERFFVAGIVDALDEVYMRNFNGIGFAYAVDNKDGTATIKLDPPAPTGATFTKAFYTGSAVNTTVADPGTASTLVQEHGWYVVHDGSKLWMGEMPFRA